MVVIIYLCARQKLPVMASFDPLLEHPVACATQGHRRHGVLHARFVPYKSRPYAVNFLNQVNWWTFSVLSFCHVSVLHLFILAPPYLPYFN